MTGSVVTSGKGSKSNARKRANEGDKENNGGAANKRQKNAGKSKAKAKASAMPSIPDEQDVTVPTIDCQMGVRHKLWIDDLLRCCEHVSEQVANLFGDPSAKPDLKARLLGQGLLFCFKSQIVLDTNKGPKLFRKWSALRAALKDHALCVQVQDSVGRAEGY